MHAVRDGLAGRWDSGTLCIARPWRNRHESWALLAVLVVNASPTPRRRSLVNRARLCFHRFQTADRGRRRIHSSRCVSTEGV